MQKTLKHYDPEVPIPPLQSELDTVDCNVEEMDQLILLAKERKKNQDSILDEVKYINQL